MPPPIPLKPRSYGMELLRNFLKTLLPRRMWGIEMGKDHFGTIYYEIPAENGRKARRYFEPPTAEDFEQEIPAEWEAWLRGRRKEPPKEEEVLRNYAIMLQTRKNAHALEAKRANEEVKVLDLPKEKKGWETFPRYKDYESNPGTGNIERGTRYE